VPGFAKLAGSVEATEAGGRLYVQSRGAELELPRVFAEPHLAFDILSGQLDWQREGAGVKVEIASMTFTNADLAGNAFGSYAYTGEGPGVLDVSAVLNRADAKSCRTTCPSAPSWREAPQWLVQGILAGEASDVQVRLQGDLRQFPFNDPASGQFSVRAHVQHGLLSYAQGWPRIEELDAELAFERNHMEITGKSARVLGAKLHDVKVGIADLASPARRVVVNGQAQGPTAEFLQFLQTRLCATAPVVSRLPCRQAAKGGCG